MTARLEANAEPLPGYRLIERLGGGGFGEVWKCEAPGGLHKAIKFVYGDLQSTEDAERPEQELKALARVKTVRHPYILSLERYDIIDGQLLIVMELADRNLWDRFKECRAQGLPGIPRDELLGYMEEVAEALDLMNNQYQLQHLDIKPQNLFLVHNHVKVADFGLVKDLAGLETKVTGGITPVYAAPETFDGVVSRHSDQYSLAICYQELLTGQRPFSASNIRQLILQHLQGEPNVSNLPPRDQPVILRGLAKVPTERFPTCQELVQLLRREPAVTPEKPPPAGPGEPLRGGEPPVTQFTPGPIVPSQVGTDPDLGTTRSLRNHEAPPAPLTTDSGRPLAPAEVAGDGCLFPTLVVGLGQTGLRVLRRLRERLVEQVGGLDAVPNVKLLLIDTDPDAPRAAVQGRGGKPAASEKGGDRGGAGLENGEVHIAPLNRPSHYLKGRDGQPNLETWLPPRLVYRIPRSQVTTGVRALGRLAFCDNYRALRHRLDADLDRILDPAVLQRAAKTTKLGLRTNRPRVYVVANLAGGTGGGMFLDLAYTLRALLKKRGYDQPDVVAVLFAPDPERARPGSTSVVNTFASLAELRHYATPGTTFTAQYHDKEPPVRDAEPPFSRTVLLRLPDEANDAATREAHDLAGQVLFRDVATPLGRTADLGRAGLSGPPWAERGLYFETVGLYRLSWPRRELLHEIARHLCLRLVARWMSKDSKPVASRVAAFVKAQWRDHNLGPEVFIERVRERLAELLRKDPETMLAALVEPLLRTLRATPPPPPPKRWGQSAPAAFEIPAEELGQVMEEVERVVGKPVEETLHDQAGELGGLLRVAVEELTAAWSQKLAEVTVRLLEEPDYRLAGAEEAVRQVLALLEQVLQRYEPLGKELEGQARQGHRTLVEFQAGRGRQFGLGQEEAITLVRSYPKLRLQSLILHQVVQAFLCLRGHLSDELREIGYCRDRLSELHRSLDALGPPLPGKSHPGRAVKTLGPEIAGRAAPEQAGGRVLLPGGCRALDEAVARVVADVGPDLLTDLDQRVEEMIRRDYQALVHVCMNSSVTLKEVERALLRTAADYAAGHLADTNVAELFLQQTHSTGLQVAELEGCLAAAEPKLRVEGRGRPDAATVRSEELLVLVRPACEAGDQIQQLLEQAAPGQEVSSALGGEDLVFYRERVHLHLDQLDHLAGLAREAYREVIATAHLTPHARVDVDFSAEDD